MRNEASELQNMAGTDETEVRLDPENVAERRTLLWVLGINFAQVIIAGAVGILADSPGLLGTRSR